MQTCTQKVNRGLRLFLYREAIVGVVEAPMFVFETVLCTDCDGGRGRGSLSMTCLRTPARPEPETWFSNEVWMYA